MRHLRKAAFALTAPAVALGAFCLSTQASAQTGGDLSAGGAGDVPGVRETGVQLGESTLLHVGVTAEAGYDTNVFYKESEPEGAAMVRVTPSMEITNASRDGSVPSTLHYTLGLSLQYREYVSDDDNIRAQRAFNPVAVGSVEFSPSQAFSLSVADQFTRVEEPPYLNSTSSIVRDLNLAWLQLRGRPGGGRIQGLVRYTNTLDIFETEQYENSSYMGHELMLDLAWNMLPKTALFLQASQGYITYLESSSRQRDSYPLRTMFGLRGLLTTKLSVLLGAGYTAGFYQGGADSPSGLSNLLVQGELSYRPGLLSRIGLGYRHEFRNSPIIGDYYDLDSPYLSLNYLLASRLVLAGFSRYEFRRYKGAMANGAKQHLLVSGVQADFFVQKWFYTGVGYTYTYSDGQETTSNLVADYSKSLVFGRVGITY